ncbi:MAG: hypothetical protein LBO76_06680, partial [Treponema sp.]|nr:hypothetical protein [Treponema sp.]
MKKDNTPRRRGAGLAALVVVLILPMAGCSRQDKTQAAPGATPAAVTAPAAAQAAGVSNEYPIVIRHAFGETVIERKPERVATIQWANQDVVLALGLVPVGFSAANYGVSDGSGILPWTAKRLKELGVDKP